MRIKNQFCFHILFSYLTRISHYLQINYHLRSTKVLSLEMLWHCIKFLSVPAYSPSFVKQDHMYSHWSTILIQLFKSSCKFTCVVHHLALSVTLYMHVHLFAHKDRGIVTDSFQSLIHPGTADPSGLVFGKSFNFKVEKMKPSFLKYLVINFFEIRVLYTLHFFQFSCVYKRKINRLQWFQNEWIFHYRLISKMLWSMKCH